MSIIAPLLISSSSDPTLVLTLRSGGEIATIRRGEHRTILFSGRCVGRESAEHLIKIVSASNTLITTLLRDPIVIQYYPRFGNIYMENGISGDTSFHVDESIILDICDMRVRDLLLLSKSDGAAWHRILVGPRRLT